MNKLYFLALNRLPHVGPRTTLKLLNRWPNLAELFDLSYQDMLAAGLPDKLARALHQFDLAEIEKDLNWEQQSADHHLITFDHAAYPALLKEIYDPPMVLYAKGCLEALQQLTVAMVGTRKPSVTGSETAYQFAHELAKQNITVVSGLALGIDAQAHRGCLAAPGKTIAVMGTGIDQIYPFQHRQLADKISQNGLILTEFSLKTRPNAGHFPRRNRIISGLSLATLVVEAAIKSGSLITARMSLEQNRDVWAVPGSILNPQARGCHYLLQQGAKLITSAQDIVDELQLIHSALPVKDEHPSLASNDKNLVRCMGFEVTTIDQLCRRSGLSVNEVACNLAELELEGIVQAVPGGYMRCI